MVSGWGHSNVVIIFYDTTILLAHFVHNNEVSIAQICHADILHSAINPIPSFVLHGHQNAKSLGDDDSKEQETCTDSHAFLYRMVRLL